jgi:hypothetical protein
MEREVERERGKEKEGMDRTTGGERQTVGKQDERQGQTNRWASGANTIPLDKSWRRSRTHTRRYGSTSDDRRTGTRDRHVHDHRHEHIHYDTKHDGHRNKSAHRHSEYDGSGSSSGSFSERSGDTGEYTWFNKQKRKWGKRGGRKKNGNH